MKPAEQEMVTNTLMALFDGGIIGYEVALEVPEEIKQFHGRDPSPKELRTAYVAVFANMVMGDLARSEGRHRVSYQRTDDELLKRAEFLLCTMEIMRREIAARGRREAKKTRKTPRRRPQASSQETKRRGGPGRHRKGTS